MLWVLLFALTCARVTSQTTSPPVVKLSNGALLKGVVSNGVRVFRGIPYGAVVTAWTLAQKVS